MAAREKLPLEIPGYRIDHAIGKGGQAQVYVADRVRDGQRVALKVLDRSLRHDGNFFERFQREYKLIASLQNEFVARIYDQGVAGDYAYIAMEYLPGGTLAARMHGGLPSRTALRITAQVARALDAIHGRGIVHRDLKPANILFRADGRAVIVDFGLAKNLGSNSAQLTVAGQLVATPRYMSPEQCFGNAVDARSDLYSLGVIFYEMLTGKRLYDAENVVDLVHAHMHAPVPRLPAHLAGYQPIVDRLLAKDPEQRFQSARELFTLIAI